MKKWEWVFFVSLVLWLALDFGIVRQVQYAKTLGGYYLLAWFLSVVFALGVSVSGVVMVYGVVQKKARELGLLAPKK